MTRTLGMVFAAGLTALATAAVLAPSSPATRAQPPGVTAEMAAAAAEHWLEACSSTDLAAPPGCPLDAADPGDGQPGRFRWKPGRIPIITRLDPVVWSGSTGLYRVSGAYTPLLEFRTPRDGGVLHFRQRGGVPFSIALRWAADDRAYGAYSTLGPTVTVDGFRLIDYQSHVTWRWFCCSPAPAQYWDR